MLGERLIDWFSGHKAPEHQAATPAEAPSPGPHRHTAHDGHNHREDVLQRDNDDDPVLA